MSAFKEGFIKYGQDHGYIKPKKKSETCEEQLRRMCKNIAEEITEGKTREGKNVYMQDFMEDVYDIEWITYQDGRYKAARLMVAVAGLIFGSTHKTAQWTDIGEPIKFIGVMSTTSGWMII